MMYKVYTAQEMREFANYNDAAYARNPGLYSSAVSAALRQAADALEREERIRSEIKKISTMAVAPLDGHPMHQHTNTEKVAAVLEFFPKVKEILGGAKSLERMANRIGFSHHYSKMHRQTRGVLVGVFVYVIDRKWFPDETRQYDTDGVFPLEDGEYLQLVFVGDKQIPFTTYRKNTPENREKYCGRERQVFDFYFKGEKSDA